MRRLLNVIGFQLRLIPIYIDTVGLQHELVTVKRQRWVIVDGKKDKEKSDDKGVQVRRAELVQWIRDSEVYRLWESGRLIEA